MLAVNLNTFLHTFKGFYSSENKNSLSWTLLAAMLEVVVHFILKKSKALIIWVKIFMLFFLLNSWGIAAYQSHNLP